MSTIKLYASYIYDFYNAYPALSIIIAIFIVIATLLPLIEYTFRGVTWLTSCLRNVWRTLTSRPTIPRQTLRAVPEGNSLFCNAAVHYNSTATALSGTWYIMNITDRPVSLLAARIKSPRKAAGTEASMKECILEPHASPQRISIRFTVYPIVHRQGKPFKATIILVDQYSNEHVFKNLLFKVPDHILFRSE